MKRAIPKPTPEQQARQDKARAMGCIACRMDGVANQCGWSQIHHQTQSGRQLGQDETVCLGAWHHMGQCLPGYTSTDMKIEFGPSLAKGSKPFYERYGTNAEQLEYQNRIIER